MKFKVFVWNRLDILRRVLSIDTSQFHDIELPRGKHFAHATESVILNSMDGTYYTHDVFFNVEGVNKYEEYPIAYNPPFIGAADPVASATILIVADRPFKIKESFMIPDPETWGAMDAPRDTCLIESQPISK